jgi:Domain of unknown function (DUF5753)
MHGPNPRLTVRGEGVRSRPGQRNAGGTASYADALPEPFAAFVALEQDASSIGDHSSELVPGLLQTADYARAIRRADLHDDEATTEGWLTVRTKRQARLTGADPVTYWVVLNEAVTGMIGCAEAYQVTGRAC